MNSRPYKDANLLIKDIEVFLQDHSALFKLQGKKIGHFFEMNCYNYVVKFYMKAGFTVVPQNLDGKVFKYKISAAGNPDNFSYFLVSKQLGDQIYEFEIHHNLSLECAYEDDIFYTADVSVINKNSIQRGSPATYAVKRSYCKANNLQTFFEIKHLAPFPELLFSFSGIPNSFLQTNGRTSAPVHLAPSLLISGRPNFHADKIKNYLEKRHDINIILNLFRTPSAVYSKNYPKRTIGSLVS